MTLANPGGYFMGFINTLWWLLVVGLLLSCARDPSMNGLVTDVGEIPLKGAPRGEYLRVAGLAVNSRGEILIRDLKNSRLLCFALDGSYLKEIGRKDRRTGDVSYPSAMVFDREDNLYVACPREVVVFDSDYKLKMKFETGFKSIVSSMAVDSLGNIYLVGYRSEEPESQGVVHKYNSRGDWLESFGQLYPHSDLHIRRYYSGGFILLKHNRIYLSHYASYDLEIFDLDGNVIDGFQRPELSFAPNFEILEPGKSYRYHRASRTLSICSLGDSILNYYYLSQSGTYLDFYDMRNGSVQLNVPFNASLLNSDREGNIYYMFATGSSIFRGRFKQLPGDAKLLSDNMPSCEREARQ